MVRIYTTHAFGQTIHSRYCGHKVGYRHIRAIPDRAEIIPIASNKLNLAKGWVFLVSIIKVGIIVFGIITKNNFIIKAIKELMGCKSKLKLQPRKVTPITVGVI